VRRQTMRGLVREWGAEKGGSGVCGSRKQAAAKGIVYFYNETLNHKTGKVGLRRGKGCYDARRGNGFEGHTRDAWTLDTI
jgi:hypothetical protein